MSAMALALALVTTACGGGAAAGGGPRAQLPPVELTGKLNLNTATEAQLMLLPGVGPVETARIIAWRKTHRGFKRTSDLRRVKGFGYRMYKELEPFLDVKGVTTLAPAPARPGTR